MDVNVEGVFFGSQAALKRMVQQGSGSIINISSVSGLVGVPNSSIYSTSKGADRTMTYSIAAEFGPDGVRVNVIHPGFIETAFQEDRGTSDEEREATK